jgi:uncharacterized repeat protein (TIGR01451 family)
MQNRNGIRHRFVQIGLVPLLLIGVSQAWGQSADIAVELLIVPDEVVCEETATYIVRVVNNGPNEAAGVVATHELPECVNFEDLLTVTQGNATLANRLITVNFGTIAANAEALAIFNATVTRECTPSYESVVNVATETDDPDLQNNEVTVVTEVVCGQLRVDKYGPEEAVQCGDTISYVILVQQELPGNVADLEEVIVTDELPQCLEDVTCVASEGTCTVDNANVLTATLEMPENGAAVVLIITATVTEDCAPSISNTAEISAEGLDLDPNNLTNDNLVTETVTTQVTCPTGACCFPDDPCAVLPQYECVEEGGLYMGDQTTCEQVDQDGDGICDVFDPTPDGDDDDDDDPDRDRDGLIIDIFPRCGMGTGLMMLVTFTGMIGLKRRRIL